MLFPSPSHSTILMRLVCWCWHYHFNLNSAMSDGAELINFVGITLETSKINAPSTYSYWCSALLCSATVASTTISDNPIRFLFIKFIFSTPFQSNKKSRRKDKTKWKIKWITFLKLIKCNLMCEEELNSINALDGCIRYWYQH